MLSKPPLPNLAKPGFQSYFYQTQLSIQKDLWQKNNKDHRLSSMSLFQTLEKRKKYAQENLVINLDLHFNLVCDKMVRQLYSFNKIKTEQRMKNVFIDSITFLLHYKRHKQFKCNVIIVSFEIVLF